MSTNPEGSEDGITHNFNLQPWFLDLDLQAFSWSLHRLSLISCRDPYERHGGNIIPFDGLTNTNIDTPAKGIGKNSE
ncbi:hypothetical protein SDJN02_19427, partial [Cucurbita argyrosperma subsp. argyrosperma]